MKEKSVKLFSNKNERGFINLYIELDGRFIAIKVDDYNGKEKNRARKLAYKLYCLSDEVK